MAEEEEESELSDKQKVEIAKWFLLNSPPGEIQYVAKGSSSSLLFISFTSFCFFYISIFLIVSSSDVKSILNDDNLFNEAASEAFPLYNKSHFIVLSMSDRSGDVTNFLSISRVSYFFNCLIFQLIGSV
jgi:capping protein alpha